MSIARIFLSYNDNNVKYYSISESEFIMPYYPRIRNLREDKDITQKRMGEILSCSQRVYSNYERGDIDIPTITLIKIANFHNVSVDYLLNRTDNPKTNK